MAMRRPRIKALANLANVKRKKAVDEVKPEIASKEEGKRAQNAADKPEESVLNDALSVTSTKDNSTEDEGRPAADAKEVKEAIASEVENTDASFKCPPKVDATVVPDDTSQPHAETDVIQMDLQKSLNGFPMSPSKSSRQRIRPTPIFGQRRNSFVGSSPSPHTEDSSVDFAPPPPQRRERHYSASQGPVVPSNAPTGLSQQHHHIPHKFIPSIGAGRIRTESGCSAFSDSYATSSCKRKMCEKSERAARRDFSIKLDGGVPDKSRMKMFDMIYYNPASNPMTPKPNATVITTESLKTEKIGSNSELKEETNDKATLIPVPQLKLNANGEPVLDHESLVIETTSEQKARQALANSSVIFHDENTGMNGFYTRQKRTREWPRAETIKFYRCLQTIGTDFSLMCQLFPERTRRDLKLKFKKEERVNGGQINKALLYPKIFNIEELKNQLEQENRERENIQRKLNEQKTRVKTAKAAKLAKSARPARKARTSRASRVMKTNDILYLSENANTTNTVDTAKMANPPKTVHTVKTPDIAATADAIETAITIESSDMAESFDAGLILDRTKASRMVENFNKVQPNEYAPKIEITAPTCISAIDDTPDDVSKTQNILVQKNSTAVVGQVKVEQLYVEDLQSVQIINVPMHDNNITQSPVTNAKFNVDVNDSKKNIFPTKTLIDNTNIITEFPEDSIILPFDDDNTIMSTTTILPSVSIVNNSPTLINLDNDMMSQLIVVRDNCEQSVSNQSSGAPKEELINVQVDQAYIDKTEEHKPIDMDVEENPYIDIYTGRVLDESDIQRILEELSDGTLALVSTLDEDNPDKVINEIYMVNKKNGELIDKPLDIPEPIVRGIQSVVCADELN